MYTHNLEPVLLDFGIIVIRWYSLAYIFGIVFGWWFGKKIIAHILKNTNLNFKLNDFDDLISYLIISIIAGGRVGYQRQRSHSFISTIKVLAPKGWVHVSFAGLRQQGSQGNSPEGIDRLTVVRRERRSSSSRRFARCRFHVHEA